MPYSGDVGDGFARQARNLYGSVSGFVGGVRRRLVAIEKGRDATVSPRGGERERESGRRRAYRSAATRGTNRLDAREVDEDLTELLFEDVPREEPEDPER